MPNQNSMLPNYLGQSAFAPWGAEGPKYDLVSLYPMGGESVGAMKQPLSSRYMQVPNYESNLQTDLNRRNAMESGGVGYSNTSYVGSNVRAIIDPVSGLYVNPNTRMPFSGKDATGNTYQNGKATGVAVPYSPGETINPNNPAQRYEAVNIVKSPEIAASQEVLANQFNKTATAATEDFSKYLAGFKSQVDSAAAKSNAATNIAPLADTLRRQQDLYSGQLGQSRVDYEALNKQIAANQADIVAKAQGLIPEYDAAINRVGDYQSGIMGSQLMARYAGGSTPRSLGSGIARELVRGEAAVRVPLEQAKIGQRYNILSQYAQPAVQDAANRETARIASFNPAIAAQQFQTGQATEQTIQQLSMATANMSYENAARYMQSLGVPWEIQQRIMSGNISNLGGLSQLYSQSRYQGLQDRLGASVTPATNTTFTAPGYPGAPTYSGQNTGAGRVVGGGVVGASPNYPAAGVSTAVAPTAASAGRPSQYQEQLDKGWHWDSYNAVWRDASGAVMQGPTKPAGQLQYPAPAGPEGWSDGRQSNSAYDPTTGLTYDKTTGQVTGGTQTQSDYYGPGLY